MTSLKTIPLKEIHMKNGINIGGYQYRVYQSGPVWSLHLHPVGGFVSLLHNESKVTHYVALSVVESSEGFVDYALGQDVSTASSMVASNTGSAPASGGLVANQSRHEVTQPPTVAVNAADDLGSSVTSEQRDAKAAHFGSKAKPEQFNENEVSEPVSDAVNEAVTESVYNAPVKKKRGRPRKIRPEETVNA